MVEQETGIAMEQEAYNYKHKLKRGVKNEKQNRKERKVNKGKPDQRKTRNRHCYGTGRKQL